MKPTVLTETTYTQQISPVDEPTDCVMVRYDYNCTGAIDVPRHLPQQEIIVIAVEENIDPRDAVIEVSPARSASRARNIHVNTTWAAVEVKLMDNMRSN